MECVILAGGLGTRMRPATDTIPKALIPVAGEPFVNHQLRWLAGEGIERVIFSIGYRGELLSQHVGDGGRFGLTVDYVDEGVDLRGTGGALRLALDQGALPASFLVLYGDSFLLSSVAAVWKAFLAGGAPALMTVFRNDGRWDRSNVEYVEGSIRLYDKHSTTPEMRFIDYGLSALSRPVVELIPPGTRCDLADLFRDLSLSGRLAGLEVHERFFEVGSPEGLADLETYLGEMSTERG